MLVSYLSRSTLLTVSQHSASGLDPPARVLERRFCILLKGNQVCWHGKIPGRRKSEHDLLRAKLMIQEGCKCGLQRQESDSSLTRFRTGLGPSALENGSNELNTLPSTFSLAWHQLLQKDPVCILVLQQTETRLGGHLVISTAFPCVSDRNVGIFKFTRKTSKPHGKLSRYDLQFLDRVELV